MMSSPFEDARAKEAMHIEIILDRSQLFASDRSIDRSASITQLENRSPRESRLRRV